MRRVIFVLFFSPNGQYGGGGGMLPDFLFCALFPVQQTTSGIGHPGRCFFSSFLELVTNALNVRNNKFLIFL